MVLTGSKHNIRGVYNLYNILICDERYCICSKIYLSSESCNIYEAYNGKEALKIVNSHDIPHSAGYHDAEMDGISAVVEIRRDKNIPIILLTAKSEDIKVSLNIGADDYITSPLIRWR